jgi:hypothetical protein
MTTECRQLFSRNRNEHDDVKIALRSVGVADNLPRVIDAGRELECMSEAG